jgi:predicted esterase YcpF (UPF0227 family)
MILYIHGFRTTPQSHKADLLKKYFKDSILIADFRVSPDEAIEDLEELIQKYPITGIIASSLGGFYASYLSECHNIKTVLINPSIAPYETTRRYLGENTRDDGSIFIWNESNIDNLCPYIIKTPNTENYCIFLQTGDEVLDYTVAKKHYEGSKMIIEEGGNHRFDQFERYFDDVSAFLSIDF